MQPSYSEVKKTRPSALGMSDPVAVVFVVVVVVFVFIVVIYVVIVFIVVCI